MGYWNAFSLLYDNENPQYPHARTLRSGFVGGFKKKMKDAYYVIRGSNFHVGLIDYATLFIPRIIGWLNRRCLNTLADSFSLGTIPAFFLLFLTYPLTVICKLLRPLAAAILTVLVSPIVFLVQVGASIASRSLKEKIYNIPVKVNSNEISSENLESTQQFLLGQILDKNKVDLEDIVIKFDTEKVNNNIVDVMNIKIRQEEDSRLSTQASIVLDENMMGNVRAGLDAMVELNVSSFCTLFDTHGLLFSSRSKEGDKLREKYFPNLQRKQDIGIEYDDFDDLSPVKSLQYTLVS